MSSSRHSSTAMSFRAASSHASQAPSLLEAREEVDGASPRSYSPTPSAYRTPSPQYTQQGRPQNGEADDEGHDDMAHENEELPEDDAGYSANTESHTDHQEDHENGLYGNGLYENDHNDHNDHNDAQDSALSVPVETLVEHLLAARRALGTINQVLRGNELATQGHALHAETVALAVQTVSLRQGIREQVAVLRQLRRGMGLVYDAGRREFGSLLQTLDAANGQLEHTMAILRATTVSAVFRPPGEAPRNLLDFVDEAGVEALQNSIKESISELQAAQTSFDGDLLRFDTDLRTLNTVMAAAPAPPPPLPIGTDTDEENRDNRDQNRDGNRDENNHKDEDQDVPYLLASLTNRSHIMAENLASLTRHFDMCVTAVRTTEGGSALALWRAAQSQEDLDKNGKNRDTVSISGVIKGEGQPEQQQPHHLAELEPISAEERAEMLQVVLQDAAEVDDVVADTAAELQAAEQAFASVQEHHEQTLAAYKGTMAALQILEMMGDGGDGVVVEGGEGIENGEAGEAGEGVGAEGADKKSHGGSRGSGGGTKAKSKGKEKERRGRRGTRLRSYAAAQTEYVERWSHERTTVEARLADMEALRLFYEGYANAYDTLLLEAERRRTVENKIQAVWRKARDTVDRLVAADVAERESFRHDVGEYLPTDLWVDMDRPPRGHDYLLRGVENGAAQGGALGGALGGVLGGVLGGAQGTATTGVNGSGSLRRHQQGAAESAVSSPRAETARSPQQDREPESARHISASGHSRSDDPGGSSTKTVLGRGR